MEYSDGLRKLFKLPDEDTNIIDQPENKAIATRLTQALHEKRGNIMNIKVNSLSDTNLDVSEKKKIEERLVALGYL